MYYKNKKNGLLNNFFHKIQNNSIASEILFELSCYVKYKNLCEILDFN